MDSKLGYYQSLRWLDSKSAREFIGLLAGFELSEVELAQLVAHGEASSVFAAYVDVGVSDGAIDADTGLLALTTGRKQRLAALEASQLRGSPLRLFVYHEAEHRPDGRIYLPSQPSDLTLALEDCLADSAAGLGLWFANTKSLKPNYTVYFCREEIEFWVESFGGDSNNNQSIQEKNRPLQQASEDTQQLQQELEALKVEVEQLRAEKAELKADEQINPKKEDTYLHMIAGLALLVGHDFRAGKNSTNSDIRGKLFEVHRKEVLSESVVRNRLNDVKELLPQTFVKLRKE